MSVRFGLSHLDRASDLIKRGNRFVEPSRVAAGIDKEFGRLLKATTGHNKLPEESRKLVYRLARRTGFRACEIGTLTTDCFELDANPAVIVIEPTISKHRKEDRQVIPKFLVAELRKFLRGREGLLFPGKWWRRASEMLQVDLEAAGTQ